MSLNRSPYFYPETLIIQAEDTLFSVLKHILALPGTWFESALLLPTANNQDPNSVSHSPAAGPDQPGVEGKSEDSPIRLPEGITALRFTHFLSCVYPNSGPASPKPSTMDEWMGVYDLSAMWSFESVRHEASQALKEQVGTKSGVECIQLGMKYAVGPWIQSGLFRLIQQGFPLDIHELKAAGLSTETICWIYFYRDRILLTSERRDPSTGLIPPGALLLKLEETTVMAGAEDIFARDFSAFGGLGKDDLAFDYIE